MSATKLLLSILLFFFSSSLFAANYNLPNNQWRLISLPENPPSSGNTVAKVFGDDISGGVYGDNWVLYQYDTQKNSYGEALELNDSLEQGRGYWIIQKTGSPVALKMPAGSVATPNTYVLKIASVTRNNSSQWTLSGNPFSSPQTLGNFFLRTDSGVCATPCDLDKAKAEKLLHNKVWIYDGSGYVLKDKPAELNPWDGFWAASLASSQGLKLSLQKGSSPENKLVRDFELPSPLFSTASAWRQRADGSNADVVPSDDVITTTYQVLMGDNSDFGGDLKNEEIDPNASIWLQKDVWTYPVFRASNTKKSIEVCDYDSNKLKPPKVRDSDGDLPIGGPVEVDVPAGFIRPAGPKTDPIKGHSDGHLVLFNPGTSIEWDYWQATVMRKKRCDNDLGSDGGGGIVSKQLLEAGSATFFDVKKAGVSFDGEYSAAASGFPLLAGTLLPEDFETGEIKHALKFSIPGPRKDSYEYPATSAEGSHYSKNPNAMIMGSRIRLRGPGKLVDKAGREVVESTLSPATRMVVAALRKYGAYLGDNAGGFIFYAEDVHTGKLDLDEDKLNKLVGNPKGTSLGKRTHWDVLISTVQDELQEYIPFAFGSAHDGEAPSSATVENANFEVVSGPSSQPPR
jgi:hypothetical protein